MLVPTWACRDGTRVALKQFPVPTWGCHDGSRVALKQFPVPIKKKLHIFCITDYGTRGESPYTYCLGTRRIVLSRPLQGGE